MCDHHVLLLGTFNKLASIRPLVCCEGVLDILSDGLEKVLESLRETSVLVGWTGVVVVCMWMQTMTEATKRTTRATSTTMLVRHIRVECRYKLW